MKTTGIAQNLLIDIPEAITRLAGGQIGVMPTDTVYGVVVPAHDKAAVARLYELKQREQKPGTVIAANLTQVRELGVSERHLATAGQWWPNPLSIVLPIGETFSYLHQGVGDIAIRVVDDETLRHILEQTGPLLTSSANHPGEPGSTTITEAWNYFERTVDFYVDGGDLSSRTPSTIIRLSNIGEITVLRKGAVTF